MAEAQSQFAQQHKTEGVFVETVAREKERVAVALAEFEQRTRKITTEQE